MDIESQLQARSVELAERLYRQKQRASDTELWLKLDNAADELIKLDHRDRFYYAQSMLEADTLWTEEWRALAHELNRADIALQGDLPMYPATAKDVLRQWAELYLKSSDKEINQTGNDLIAALDEINDRKSGQHKEMYNYVLSVLETLLTHRAEDDEPGQIDPTVRMIRTLRDAILVDRHLTVDVKELIAQDKAEDQMIERIGLARGSIEEIYKQIPPVTIPS